METSTTSSTDFQNLFYSLFNHTNDIVIFHEENGNIIHSNPHTKVLFTQMEKEKTSINIYDLLDDKSKESYFKHLKGLENNQNDTFECYYKTKHKNPTPTMTSLTLIELTEQTLIQVVIKNIYREKKSLNTITQTNKELEMSKNNLVEAQKIAQIGSWELDLSTSKLTWSDEVYRIFDLEVDEFEANYQAFLDHIHPDDSHDVNHEYMLSVMNKSPYNMVHRIITKDGKVKYVEERCYHETNEKNEIIRSIGTVQDITDRKKAEVKLKNAEEMLIVQSKHAAMGELLSMIAHQWKQPISIIGMLLNTMKQSVQLKKISYDLLEEDLKTIEQQVNYMSLTINDFGNFFKKSKAIKEVNVAELLLQVKNILRSILQQYQIELRIHCQSNITLSTYDRELVQILINIVSNAKDALKELKGEKNIIIDVEEKNQEVAISIFNNGSHIGQELQDKIFEPYFTTKEEKEGTGLGLYMVKSILKNHMNGTITVNNKLDGVVFTITLPKVFMGKP